MKLSINLVTQNGEKYLPHFFDSLNTQTFRDWELVVIDNASVDRTLDIIDRQRIAASNLTRNPVNVGFAAAHNQAWQKSNSEYVLITNQDIYLQSDCLEKMIRYLDERQDVAAAAPRLMKWNFTHGLFTNIIDSLGLKITHSRRALEIGEGETWNGTEFSTNAIRVFGVSGACAMFRRNDIRKVFIDNELLEESYIAYKEDVDLAYRINSAGFSAAVVLDAVAYHDRTGHGTKEKTDFASLKNKLKQPQPIRYYSYKNHIITLIRNEYWQNLLLDFPWILWYEFKKALYFVIFDHSVFVGWKEIWCERKTIWRKRKLVISQKKATWKQVRQWFE